jgi:hypothetical protein
MKLTSWMCAAATAALGLSAAPAYADAPRSVFCMATRTTPRLDQNNYVVGAMGQVFVTRNFTTDLPDEQLIPMWRAFIIAKHPASAPGVPDDSCYPDNARRTKVSTFGDVKTLTVKWTPTP